MPDRTFGEGTFGEAIFGAESVGVSGVGPVFRSLAPITCVIDGRPVPLMDWQAQVDADWGDRSLTGRLPKVTSGAMQGAPVALWRPNGEPLWSGELSQDPRSEGDTYSIRALGLAEILAANDTRMLYRIDGAEQWVEQDAEPHEFDFNQQFDLTSKTSKLEVRMGNGGAGTISSPDGAGFMIWLEGAEITKYRVTVFPIEPYTQFDFVTRRFNGPTGGRTDINTYTLNTASPTVRSDVIGTLQDALYFRVECTGSAASSTRRKVRFTAISVYGRTDSDLFTASDVIADVGLASGMASTNVQDHGMPVLPLDWLEDHPALCTYMAALTDWHWEARGDGLHFGPWEKTWRAFTNRDCSPGIEPEPRFNRFPVRYEALSGAHREVIGVPSVDPFPGDEFVAEGVDLEDRQVDAQVAEAVASAGAEQAVQRNMSGPVELARVRDDRGGVHSPYAACAGDLLLMPDLDIGPQRIRSITYRPDDQATAELGETFSPLHVIATTRREKRRPRRRRRRAA
jgi:hypothetical protein